MESPSKRSRLPCVLYCRSMKGLGRLIFWEYPRTSWQWDVIVAAILAFIFLTPRSVFQDTPRGANIVMLPSQQGFLLDPQLLDGVAEASRPAEASRLVRGRFKTPVAVTRVEPVVDSNGTLTGYVAK